MRKNDLSGVEKGGEDRYRFIQTLISASEHRALRLIALDEDATLTKLLREIIQNFLKQKET